MVKGKTASSIRQVHLSERAQDVLSYRINKFTGENLFPQNDIDGRASTLTLDKLHLETIKKLNLKFRLYDARHTFASRAVEDGIDLLVLASILGHSNLKMVMRYAHPSETFKAERSKEWKLKEKQKQSKSSQFAAVGYIIRYSRVLSFYLTSGNSNKIKNL